MAAMHTRPNAACARVHHTGPYHCNHPSKASMAPHWNQPAFVTFTGVDRADLLPGMQALSKRFPIEWGVLIDPDQENRPLYPGRKERQRIQPSALRLSAHVCGAAAKAIVEGDDPELDLAGFSRVQ